MTDNDGLWRMMTDNDEDVGEGTFITTILLYFSDRLVRIWKPSQTLEDKITIMDMDE